jgi:hypothetical protein
MSSRSAAAWTAHHGTLTVKKLRLQINTSGTDVQKILTKMEHFTHHRGPSYKGEYEGCPVVREQRPW